MGTHRAEGPRRHEGPPATSLSSSSTKRITIRSVAPGSDRQAGLGVPADHGGRGFALSLAPTRTRLLGRPVLLDPPDGVSLREGKAPNIFLVVTGGSVERDIAIDLDFRGEPPSVGELAIPGEDDLEALEQAGTTPEEMIAARRTAVKALTSTEQAFFLDYDLGTNLKVGMQSASLTQPIEELQQALCQRVIRKARQYGTGVPYPTQSAALEIIAHVQVLGALQLALYRAHFGGSKIPSDLAGLRTAFSRFAAGELRLSGDKLYLNAEPDSAWYFFFAEFALLAAHHATDSEEREFWHVLCRTLAWTQEVYIHCYPVSPGPARFADYDPWKYQGSTIPQAITDAWLGTYEGATLDQLHELTASNASTAFPAEDGLSTYPC